MKIENQVLPVTYLINGKVYRKFKVVLPISFETASDKIGIFTCTATLNSIKNFLSDNLTDLRVEQLNVNFTAKTAIGNNGSELYVGVPMEAKVELDTFQQRRLKMSALEIE